MRELGSVIREARKLGFGCLPVHPPTVRANEDSKQTEDKMAAPFVFFLGIMYVLLSCLISASILDKQNDVVARMSCYHESVKNHEKYPAVTG